MKKKAKAKIEIKKKFSMQQESCFCKLQFSCRCATLILPLLFTRFFIFSSSAASLSPWKTCSECFILLYINNVYYYVKFIRVCPMSGEHDRETKTPNNRSDNWNELPFNNDGVEIDFCIVACPSSLLDWSLPLRAVVSILCANDGKSDTFPTA